MSQENLEAIFKQRLGDTYATDNDEEHLCVVCMEQDRCVVLLPCSHMVLCAGCAPEVIKKTGACPICREPVQEQLMMENN